MLPITIEIVSGPPLEKLYTQEGGEVQFQIADRGGQKTFRVGKVTSVALDGVVVILFDGYLYKGTLFNGICYGGIHCRGRLSFQSAGRGS